MVSNDNITKTVINASKKTDVSTLKFSLHNIKSDAT